MTQLLLLPTKSSAARQWNADKADVLEFCKGIWDGEDYIDQVWDPWFRDPNGILAVAEYKGHAIGCSKVSRIAQGQWWLEGFRVDPQCQGMKVGSHLTRVCRRLVA